MTAVTQYSIIILRNENENEVPGAPVSTAPLVFGPGLEPGEVLVTADTGRMFVGHEPSIGQGNFRRTSFPYQNIEVLTENSTMRVSSMIGAYRKQEGDQSFYKAVLAPSASPTPVLMPLPSAPANELRITDIGSVALWLEYAAFNPAGKPIRMGRLQILHGDGVAVPVISDQGTDLGSPLLAFTASVDGPVDARYILVNYTYTGTGNFTLKYKITRPTFT